MEGVQQTPGVDGSLCKLANTTVLLGTHTVNIVLKVSYTDDSSVTDYLVSSDMEDGSIYYSSSFEFNIIEAPLEPEEVSEVEEVFEVEEESEELIAN
jgi:hypothetical protein